MGGEQKRGCWARFDNWLWMSRQLEFHQQCRIVPGFLKQREKVLVYFRVFWVIVLTAILCSSLMTGNVVLQIAEFDKWALVTTYFTFIFGLFSVTPIMEKELVEYD